MSSSIFGPPGLYSTLYSTPILKNRMYSSIFSPPGLYSALDSKTECRALYSVLQVYIQRYIQHPNVELYIRLSRTTLRTIFGSPCLYWVLYSTSECRALYSALQVYIQHHIQNLNVEWAQYSARQVYIQHYIHHLNVEPNIRLPRSIFSTIFIIWM